MAAIAYFGKVYAATYAHWQQKRQKWVSWQQVEVFTWQWRWQKIFLSMPSTPQSEPQRSKIRFHSKNFFLFSLGEERLCQDEHTSSPWSWLANMSCRVRDEVFSYFSKMFLFQFFTKRTDDCSLRLSSVQHYRAVIPICGT